MMVKGIGRDVKEKEKNKQEKRRRGKNDHRALMGKKMEVRAVREELLDPYEVFCSDKGKKTQSSISCICGESRKPSISSGMTTSP